MLTLRIMMEVDSGCLLRPALRLRGDVQKQPPPTTAAPATAGRVGSLDWPLELIIIRLSRC